MRIALIVALLLPMAAWGNDSAYQALRMVGKERSQAFLNNVVEVKARNGTPEPASWIVVLNDPRARGGVREIEVAKGRIVSERTPVNAYGGRGDAVLNYPKLNLDSGGAFVIAEGEARKAKIGFYGVDYLLRCDDPGSAPVWVLQLLDENQRSLGSVSIAADTGIVISKTLSSAPPKKGWAAGGGLQGHIERFGESVGRSFLHVSGNVEEFLTGERTLDKPER